MMSVEELGDMLLKHAEKDGLHTVAVVAQVMGELIIRSKAPIETRRDAMNLLLEYCCEEFGFVMACAILAPSGHHGVSQKRAAKKVLAWDAERASKGLQLFNLTTLLTEHIMPGNLKKEDVSHE